jgi:hypothetical protein
VQQPHRASAVAANTDCQNCASDACTSLPVVRIEGIEFVSLGIARHVLCIPTGQPARAITCGPIAVSLSGTDGIAFRGRGCRIRLRSEAILQAGVAELVDRPDSAEDIAFTGIFKEPH